MADLKNEVAKLKKKNKTILVTVILVLVCVGIGFIFIPFRYSADLQKINVSDVTKIEISSPYKNCSLSKKEDIQTFLSVLQKMRLRKYFNDNKSGYFLDATIVLKDKKTVSVSVTSNSIIINGKEYIPEKDYCEDLRKVLDNYEKSQTY